MGGPLNTTATYRSTVALDSTGLSAQSACCIRCSQYHGIFELPLCVPNESTSISLVLMRKSFVKALQADPNQIATTSEIWHAVDMLPMIPWPFFPIGVKVTSVLHARRWMGKPTEFSIVLPHPPFAKNTKRH